MWAVCTVCELYVRYVSCMYSMWAVCTVCELYVHLTLVAVSCVYTLIPFLPSMSKTALTDQAPHKCKLHLFCWVQTTPLLLSEDYTFFAECKLHLSCWVQTTNDTSFAECKLHLFCWVQTTNDTSFAECKLHLFCWVQTTPLLLSADYTFFAECKLHLSCWVQTTNDTIVAECKLHLFCWVQTTNYTSLAECKLHLFCWSWQRQTVFQYSAVPFKLPPQPISNLTLLIANRYTSPGQIHLAESTPLAAAPAAAAAAAGGARSVVLARVRAATCNWQMQEKCRWACSKVSSNTNWLKNCRVSWSR